MNVTTAVPARSTIRTAATSVIALRGDAIRGLPGPRSTDRFARRLPRSSLTAASSHGAGGSTSSSAWRNSILSARSLSTGLLHALSQLIHASLNLAFHRMDAGAGYGRDLIER